MEIYRQPTVLKLNAELEDLHAKIRSTTKHLHELNPFWAKILDIASDLSLSPRERTMKLVQTVKARDWPMSREEIKKVFTTSGFDFTYHHITACRPNKK